MRWFAGMFLVGLVSTWVSPGLGATRTADITKEMLDTTVTVRGTVQSFTASRSERAPNSFFLKDASGSIRVAIWPDVYDRIPGKETISNGASLTVTGKVSEHREKLEIHPAQVSDVVIESSIGTATAAPAAGEMNIGDTVTLSGVMDSYRPSRNGTAPASFLLKHSSGSSRVVIWPETLKRVTDAGKLRNGATVKVEGQVAEYRGAKELHVEQPEGLKVISSGQGAQSTVVTPIAELTRDRIKQTCMITGKVTSARRPSIETAPFVLKVADASGSIDVVFWMQTADQLTTSQKVESGEKVRIAGELGEHRGTLQIRVEDPKGIMTERSNPELFRQTETTTDTSSQNAPLTVKAELSEVNTGKAGRRLRVQGNVVSIEELQAGKKLVMRDGSGSATVLLWDTAAGLKPQVEHVKPSDRLSLEGYIGQLPNSGAKVLVVQHPEDVLAVGR